MPKVVDHEQRRRELGKALWRVIQQRGVEGASVRSVARESGWSPSSVQYYFRTQGELLTFALRLIHEGAHETLEALGEDASPLDTLAALLPLDDVSRTATEVWMAFLSRAVVDPSVREAGAAANDEVEQVCREVVRQLAPKSDVDLETARLHALFDGLALQAVTDPTRLPEDRVRAVLGQHLSSLR